jgi:hypothetical protein
MINRYMIETTVERDEIHGDYSGYDETTVRGLDSGALFPMRVSARVINLITGESGYDDLNVIIVDDIADPYLAECLEDCVNVAKANAGIK